MDEKHKDLLAYDSERGAFLRSSWGHLGGLPLLSVKSEMSSIEFHPSYNTSMRLDLYALSFAPNMTKIQYKLT